jgi:hypothetical protein
MRPATRYAKSNDIHIVYQVVGDGPIDLVWAPGYISHVESAWDDPSHAGFIRRLDPLLFRRWKNGWTTCAL